MRGSTAEATLAAAQAGGLIYVTASGLATLGQIGTNPCSTIVIRPAADDVPLNRLVGFLLTKA